jgi:hypothetical protein
MTEAEWLACTNPDVMLDYLEIAASERKLRLHGCACCRRMVHLWTDERCRTALEMSERFADGLASREELQAAHQGAVAAIWAASDEARDTVQVAAWVSAANAWDAADATGRVTAKVLSVAAGDPALLAIERQDQARLLREIIPNPFVPAQPRPDFSAELVAIARTVYAGMDRRAVLSEALVQAGHADLANHFQTAAHPKGCWALDHIMGKQ